MNARAAFLFDVNRCTGCRACEMACEIANGPAAADWRRVRTFNPLHVPAVELAHLSLACNHCEEAPCMEQCPSDAYSRDPRTGAVLIDADVCVGCRYCAWVCPYDAPRFDESRGVMTKCTFCSDRQVDGRGPACAQSCPTGALSWDVLEPEQWTPRPAVPGFADADTGPAIRITDLEQRRRTPECTHPPAMPPWRSLRRSLERRVTLRHEWPLALFTWLSAWLVGWVFVGVLGGPRPPWWLPAAAGGGGLLLSAAHLGRRERAWRAARNLGGSSLSREVVLAGVFVASASLWARMPSAPLVLGAVAALSGLTLLWAVDRVYRPVRIRGLRFHHSASVLDTGLLAAALFAMHWPVLVLAAVLKLAFYVDRKSRRIALGLPARPRATVLRWGLLGGAVGILALQGAEALWLAAPAGLTAELIDRAEFYDEIEIPTPDSLMLDEMERRTVA